MITEGITVAELIKQLEKVPQDFTVTLGVSYDNCLHMQPLEKVDAPMSSDINWILLKGAKE